MSIEQKVRKEVDLWLMTNCMDGDMICPEEREAFVQTFLSKFDIVEKGRAKKMERVVEAAQNFLWYPCSFKHAEVLRQALKDLEG